MASSKLKPLSKSTLPLKIGNKQKRQLYNVKQKQKLEKNKREERFRRRKEEANNPRLREERRARNVPVTIDKKRVWDEVDGATGDGLGLSVDAERLKRRKLEADEKRTELQGADGNQGGAPPLDAIEEEEPVEEDAAKVEERKEPDDDDNDNDSMLGSESDLEAATPPPKDAPSQVRSVSPSPSPADLALDPTTLSTRFPTLFNPPTSLPKLLITTSFNATIPLHTCAHDLTALFPSSLYIARTAHKYAHKYSVRDVARFASSRAYTALLVLTSDLAGKKPTGLDITHLPHGPTFHFSLQTYVPGHALPGHGRPTPHSPELVLNGFRTPLGHLAAALFRTLFPPAPDLSGRQVLTLHNQRDYIFLRRHRYVFRDKKGAEKSVVGADGKPMRGMEGIRAGLQELGPRMTLKLRRVDEGVGRGSGVLWEWKAGNEKVRTRFEL